jgi:plastocyanin
MGKLIAVILIVCLVGGGIAYYFMLINKSKINPSNTKLQNTDMQSEVKSDHLVGMNNYEFFPDTITVKAGETVAWANQDNTSHSATADDNSFDTGVFPQGDSKTVTFSEPGTYTYHCSLHPSMKGTVVVE